MIGILEDLNNRFVHPDCLILADLFQDQNMAYAQDLSVHQKQNF